LVAAAAIDQQHHRQLALLDEALDERVAHAGGDVPVDGADVVAGLVLADLLEGDAGALEDAVVLAAEQVLDGPAGPQLQAADLADDFAGEHGVGPGPPPGPGRAGGPGGGGVISQAPARNLPCGFPRRCGCGAPGC